jgi:hypothetical protein
LGVGQREVKGSGRLRYYKKSRTTSAEAVLCCHFPLESYVSLVGGKIPGGRFRGEQIWGKNIWGESVLESCLYIPLFMSPTSWLLLSLFYCSFDYKTTGRSEDSVVRLTSCDV